MRCRIHFTDRYGQGTIECLSRSHYSAVMANLMEDPETEDIWVETYDPEEGWQA